MAPLCLRLEYHDLAISTRRASAGLRRCSREPKIVAGPEILNKYVGQSEENIRALFAEAEAEEKERGDESELHIIIFDEIDAICKAMHPLAPPPLPPAHTESLSARTDPPRMSCRSQASPSTLHSQRVAWLH